MEPSQIKEYGILACLALFILKESFGWFKTSTKEHIKAIQENTIAISELKVHLKYLSERLERLPSLEYDVDEAHKAIRELKQRGRSN